MIVSLCVFRSAEGTSQGAYTFQIFLEKEQMGTMPTVQQLLETSCLSGGLKFEEVKECSSFNICKFSLQFLCEFTRSHLLSGAIVSDGANAAVWEQVQDVLSHHSLHRA